MALTPETLPRHELNGLPVRVVESDDSGRVGLAGRVVIETTKTIHIEIRDDDSSRVVTVPKSGTVFEFAITDDAAGVETALGTAFKLAETQPGSSADDEDRDRANTRAREHAAVGAEHTDSGPRGHAGENVAYVTVDGSRLLSQPARRTETSGDSPWQ